jgi:hypothetical protein
MADAPATSGTALRFPSGQEIYDALMGQIEPELVSGNLNHLDDRHPGETPEQRRARYRRYDECYAAYDRTFNAWKEKVSTAMSAYRKIVLGKAQQKASVEDAAKLDTIDSQMKAA